MTSWMTCVDVAKSRPPTNHSVRWAESRCRELVDQCMMLSMMPEARCGPCQRQRCGQAPRVRPMPPCGRDELKQCVSLTLTASSPMSTATYYGKTVGDRSNILTAASSSRALQHTITQSTWHALSYLCQFRSKRLLFVKCFKCLDLYTRWARRWRIWFWSTTSCWIVGNSEVLGNLLIESYL